MGQRSGCLVVASVLMVCALTGSATAQGCPDFVKNRDPDATFPLGEQTDLLEGFVLYRIVGQTGLYRTSLQNYAPVMIEATELDTPRSISISDNGEWVFYIDDKEDFDGRVQRFVIQRLDGTGRATYLPGNKSQVGGFYRNSPYGSEIFYMEGSKTTKAMKVDLSSDTARFLTGTIRTIASLPYNRSFRNGWNGGMTVVRDQIFTSEDWRTSGWKFRGRTGFLTIPDNGRGTAGGDDFHEWENDQEEAVWGCGHTMSWDGRYCVANSALIGSACSERTNGPFCLIGDSSISGTACLPNRKAVIMHAEADTQRFDHKGFYITRFWRDTDPVVPLDDIVDEHAYSVNWAPPEYRDGEHMDVDFTCWHFSNSSAYLVGVLTGLRLRDYGFPNGMWVIEWESNTWTSITPDTLTLTVDCPAMYITDPEAVRPGMNPARFERMAPGRRLLAAGAGNRPLVVPPGIGGIDVYSLDGKCLWKYRRADGNGLVRVQVPQSIAHRALVIVGIEQAKTQMMP